jgi:hypothetical protein
MAGGIPRAVRLIASRGGPRTRGRGRRRKRRAGAGVNARTVLVIDEAGMLGSRKLVQQKSSPALPMPAWRGP